MSHVFSIQCCKTDIFLSMLDVNVGYTGCKQLYTTNCTEIKVLFNFSRPYKLLDLVFSGNIHLLSKSFKSIFNRI